MYKKLEITIMLVVLALMISCEQDLTFPESYYDCNELVNSPNHPKEDEYSNLISEIVGSGVPGMMLTIHNNQNGYWSGAQGFADLSSGIRLSPCNITRVGSTVKTFTAVTILMLQEEGLLDLDDQITDYLSNNQIKGLENAKESTIKQLLLHSSGIYNYIQSLKFQTASLNDLTKSWGPDELLEQARGKDAYFAPGTDVLYSNTGYVLLGMIIEKVTGKPFYEVFEEKLFIPYDLTFTQFAATDPVPDGIIRGYVDLYSNLNLINATYYSGWDYYTADGGLISNAYDLNKFMTNLFQGDILSQESLKEMMTWVAPKDGYGDGFQTFYGMGIFRIETDFGTAYMHSGDAIGYFASMAYFPKQDVTITWAVNGNYGKVDEFTQSKAAMEKIYGTVLGE
ncbi:serine hydrolase domain-containing protein [Fulvivirga lutimaris]|uniref:serine hydrolase domain-containing protein n=1 Tax=Fulvivirga lutimaris TaxID=1819566 RepID=UPI0012BB880E|nr:serine hydrolase domain-containing protein [Fulvivirga lutimaris]MTI40484.1 class A beta-lactamase-related serine hydrolase [Fulvivirga lutimaris]